MSSRTPSEPPWTPYSPAPTSPSPGLEDLVERPVAEPPAGGPQPEGAPGAEAEAEPEPGRRHLTLIPGAVGEDTGTVLRGRYELLAVLGQGGMASVYEARFLPSDRRRFAVKILRRRLSRKPESARRFAREFRILDSIEHPGLVQVRDLDRADDGRLFMVMERLEGQSLDKITEPLAPERVVMIGLQLCDVLEALHAAGVIHRDLKPSNVILLDGPGDRVKLVDLGIARLEAAWYLADRPYLTPPEGRSLTRTGLVLGTPRYVPPEAGDSAPTVLWDVYALGVLLWQLLTMRPPPGSWRDEGMMEEAPEGRFGIPLLLERALRGAMAVDPKRRFGSVVELRDELEVAAAELGIDVTPPDELRAEPTSMRAAVSQAPAPAPAVVEEPTQGKTRRAHRAIIGLAAACSLVVGLAAGTLLSSPRVDGGLSIGLTAARSVLLAVQGTSIEEVSIDRDAIGERLGSCLFDGTPAGSSVALGINIDGQLESIDAGPEIDPLLVECMRIRLHGVQIADPGVASTQRLDLDVLHGLRRDRGE